MGRFFLEFDAGFEEGFEEGLEGEGYEDEGDVEEGFGLVYIRGKLGGLWGGVLCL